MRRREFICGGGAAALAYSFTGATSASSRPAPIVLRLGFTGTRAASLGVGAMRFSQKLQDLCGDRIRVDLYPSGEAGGEVECAQDVQSGVLDMAYGSSAGYGQLSPALNVFDIPFLFRGVAHARAVLDGPIGQQGLRSMDSTGVVGLAWGENGLRHITSASVPVRRSSDLVGFKLRVPQSPVEVTGFRAMGVDAQPLAFPDLYAALAAGDFQGQENPLATIRDAGFYRVQRFLSLTGHIYSAALFMIGKRVYDRLGPEDVTALHAAVAVGVQGSRDTSDAVDKSAIEDLRQRGMTIIDDVDRASFVMALAGAQQEFEHQFGAAQIAAIRNAGE